MYKRAGRLLNAAKQLTNNFCGSSSKNRTLLFFTISNKNVYNPINRIVHRNYSDEKNEESITEKPIPLTLNEEAEINLKKYLSIPENVKKLKIIELEVDIAQQQGQRVPSIMEPKHWWELVQLKSTHQRKTYLSYAFKVENMKKRAKAKKLENEEPRSPLSNDKLAYRLGKNSMFLRIYTTSINHGYHYRLMNAIQFGQPVVFDCGYENHMTRSEAKYAARQLGISFSINRCHDDPFNMYLCNANPDSYTMRTLHRLMPTMYDDDFPLYIKKESYLDLFDKQRLVYLTPHCREEMKEFDHDAVYIIGAFVDKGSNEPVSLAKAKKEKLKMARFPLERYLQWGTSSTKNLTLNAVLNILLELRLKKDWNEALKCVPSRKLHLARQRAEDRALKKLIASEGYNLNEEVSAEDAKSKIKQIEERIGNRLWKAKNSNFRSYNEEKSNFYSKPKIQTNHHSESSSDLPDFSIGARSKFKKKWSH